MSTFEDKAKTRFRILQFLYDYQAPKGPLCFATTELAKTLAIEFADMAEACRYLENERLVKRFADQGAFGITHSGIKEIEGALRDGMGSKRHFPIVIINGDVVDSQVQIASPNSSQERQSDPTKS